MKRLKDETLSIRTSSDIKHLLPMAAEKEHRSIASMVEVLVLNYARDHGLKTEAQPAEVANKKKESNDEH